MNEQVCLLQTEIQADLQAIAQSYGELSRCIEPLYRGEVERFLQFLAALAEPPASS